MEFKVGDILICNHNSGVLKTGDIVRVEAFIRDHIALNILTKEDGFTRGAIAREILEAKVLLSTIPSLIKELL